MSRLDYANTILNELGAEIGLGDIAFDASGRSSLTFDDTLVTMHYTEDPVELIWLYVDLGPAAAEGTALPLFLLELNMQAWLRSCMTLGLAAGGARVVGSNCLALATLDLPALKAVLEAMLEASRGIRTELQRPDLLGPDLLDPDLLDPDLLDPDLLDDAAERTDRPDPLLQPGYYRV
ncbi:MAG: CesT family type III secretion system chaperone [Pseudomonadota bacterium]